MKKKFKQWITVDRGYAVKLLHTFWSLLVIQIKGLY